MSFVKRSNERVHTQSLVQGLKSFVPAGGLWLLTLVGIVLLPWWAKVPLGILNGAFIGVFFIVGHDACHGILFPRRWMNRIGGRMCLMPALHPFAAWVHNHNGLHHGFTNIRERDPGFPPLSLDEYRAMPRWRPLDLPRRPHVVGPRRALLRRHVDQVGDSTARAAARRGTDGVSIRPGLRAALHGAVGSACSLARPW